MKYQVKHEENGNRGTFFISDERGLVSELTYGLQNDIMDIDHTETRQDMTGKGLASDVLDFVVEYARKNSLKIRPICSFVRAKFKEKTSYNDVQI